MIKELDDWKGTRVLINIFTSITKWKDWSAAGNCIPSANSSGVGGRPFHPAHNRQCVCVAVTILRNMELDLGAQSSSYQRTVVACRVVLNACSGCLHVGC